MVQVVRGVLLGALVGAVLGALARAFMHLVEIGMGFEADFHVDVSIGVAILFVISGAGAGVARSLDLRGWQSGLVVLASSAALYVVAGAYANDKVRQILDHDFTPPWTIELIAMVAVIVGLALVTPYAGWRVGRPRLRRAAQRVPEPAGLRR
jgi:H+/Cl- antiporter ClcA